MTWQDLIGRPYAFPSDPPASFDCWSLVKHVRGALGLACPLPFDDGAAWCIPANLPSGTARARDLWQVLGAPAAGAMAVLDPGHVGVVLAGGVLHALSRNGAVVWTGMPAIRRIWPRAEWWQA